MRIIQLLLFFYLGEQKIIYNVRWSKCGKFLFSSEYGGIIKVYDTEKFEVKDTYGKFNDNNRVYFDFV